MIGTTKRVAICAALLALGGMTVACGDDDDGGTPDAGRMDAGRDSGPGDEDAGPQEDAGQDAGPPPANVRLAHLIPGAPPVHVCLNATGSTSVLLITRNEAGVVTEVPYRGVSNYTDALDLLPIPLTVRVYAASALGSPPDCPAPGAAEPAPLITQEIDGGDLMGGSYYTVAAVGLPTGTGAQAPQLLITEDDVSEPGTAGQMKLRVFHAVPNLPVAAVDVCYDNDPTDETPAVEVFDNIAYTDVADYVETMPITGGVISVHAHNTDPVPNCVQVDAPAGTRLFQIPVPIPGLPSGEGIPANLVDRFSADTVNTIFVVGRAAAPIVQPGDGSCTDTAECMTLNPTNDAIVCNPTTMACADPLGVTVIPWQDDLDL